jgi:hypothetical protein
MSCALEPEESKVTMWKGLLPTRTVGFVRNCEASLSSRMRTRKLRLIYKKYRDFTMIPEGGFVQNLRLVESVRHISGCVVECGVWRGGMSAAMALLLGPDRTYYLFDSFEGLPPAKAIDGEAANHWQCDSEDPRTSITALRPRSLRRAR